MGGCLTTPPPPIGGRPFLGGWVLGSGAEGAEKFFLLLPIECWLKFFSWVGGSAGWSHPPPPPPGGGRPFLGGWVGRKFWMGGSPN